MIRIEELDFGNLPPTETEHLEYKSSLVGFDKLRTELQQAASAFWNTGGGVVLAGVNNDGKIDGGIPIKNGKQPVRDWADRVIGEVQPVGQYRVEPITGLASIGSDRCLLAVQFEASHRPPHMAPDKRYYIRLGVHTEAASHFLVEALWAKRNLQRPHLVHIMRLKPDADGVIQLLVIALTDAPAVAVSITLDPVPAIWKDAGDPFPIELPAIDRLTPFCLDLTTYFQVDIRLGGPINITVKYKDVAGNDYDYTEGLNLKSIVPWKLGKPAFERIADSLHSMKSSLDVLRPISSALQVLPHEIRKSYGMSDGYIDLIGPAYVPAHPPPPPPSPPEGETLR